MANRPALWIVGILGGALVIAAVIWAAGGSRSATIRYQMTATIMLDGQVLTGSTVWQTTLTYTRTMGTNVNPLTSRMRGEALRIAVPDGNDILLLRRGVGGVPESGYGSLRRDCFDKAPKVGDLIKALESFAGSCSYDVQFAPPTPVRFADPSDASTVERLTYDIPGPDGTCPRLCLLSLTATRSDAPITDGLVSYLPWLSLGYPASRIGTGEYKDPDMIGGNTVDLYNSDFSTEIARTR